MASYQDSFPYQKDGPGELGRTRYGRQHVHGVRGDITPTKANDTISAKKWLNADFPRDVMHRNPSKRGNIFMHAKTICGILKHTHSVTKNKMAGKLKKAEDGKEKVTFTSDEDTDSSATESEVDTTERVTEKDVAGGWVYLGSHNFTPSAWGRFTKTGSLSITNWELGVFLPLYGDDKVCNALADEYLTYKRPVEKYGENDVPWVSEDFMLIFETHNSTDVYQLQDGPELREFVGYVLLL